MTTTPTTRTTDTILDRIVADNRALLAERQAVESLAALRARAEAAPAPRPFAPALVGQRLALIAEVKKASPSKGLLEENMDPVARAGEYAAHGASAISVLTEPKHFLGDLAFLRAIKDGLAAAGIACPPLLRKDFLFDPYQLYEARAAGADAVLLIVACLDPALLADLLALAGELGVGALVEVHDEAEVETALASGARVIGVNNRDLKTFHTDLAVTTRLRPLVPPDRTFVSESGIHTAEHARMLRALPVDAILVGESLMVTGDIGAKMRELIV